MPQFTNDISRWTATVYLKKSNQIHCRLWLKIENAFLLTNNSNYTSKENQATVEWVSKEKKPLHHYTVCSTHIHHAWVFSKEYEMYDNAFAVKIRRKKTANEKRFFFSNNAVLDHHTMHTANYAEYSFISSCAFLLIAISRYVNFMKKFLKFYRVCAKWGGQQRWRRRRSATNK